MNTRQFDDVVSPAFDYVELTFQADVEGETLSASCASLAYGYENQVLRAAGENVIMATFFAR